MRWALSSIWMALTVCGLLLGISEAVGEVTLVHLDGKSTGPVACTELTSTRIHIAADGAERVMALEDLAEIAFSQSTAEESTGDGASMPLRVRLAGGGIVSADLVANRPDRIVVRTRFAEALVVPLRYLTSVEFAHVADADARALFNEAAGHRQTGYDVLITRGEEAKALRGTLVQLGPAESVFVFNNRQRTLDTAKVYGVVFAQGPDAAPADAVKLELAGGDRFAATIESLDAQTLRVAAFGQTVGIPRSMLARIHPRSTRVQYLSDLVPQRSAYTHFTQQKTPMRADRNADLGPLSLGGRRYVKGLGMRARSEIDFHLDGAYESFAATVGIDDAVGAGGSVTFIVRTDGAGRFSSDVLRGGSPPQDILIDMRGVQTLTLIVEPADNLDVGDWADWAAARLIRSREVTP